MINTAYGAKNTPQHLIESGKCLGVNKLQIITKIVLPSAMPHIGAGMRISLGLAFISMTEAEMIMYAGQGLGYLIMLSWRAQRFEVLLAAIVLIGILNLTFDRVFRYFVEEKLLKWEKGIVK